MLYLIRNNSANFWNLVSGQGFKNIQRHLREFILLFGGDVRQEAAQLVREFLPDFFVGVLC